MDLHFLLLEEETVMKINCISCGHNIELDNAYDNFVGLVKCYVCSGLMEIRTHDGELQAVGFAVPPHRQVQQQPPAEH